MSASKSILRLAEKKGVQIHLHNIIYKLIDGLKEELSSTLPALLSHNVLGSCAMLHKLVHTLRRLATHATLHTLHTLCYLRYATHARYTG